MREIVADGRFQFADTPEGAASNAALGEQAEETLDLIQPTSTGGREMQMITGPPRKPPLYFGHLVRAICPSPGGCRNSPGPPRPPGPGSARTLDVAADDVGSQSL